jgi:DNA-binding response OmpR family regulator
MGFAGHFGWDLPVKLNGIARSFSVGLSTHISHLRKKIEDYPKTPRYIITVWGSGYKFQGD